VRRLIESVRGTRLPVATERVRIRRKAGVSLRRAADALGVSAAAVQSWERGQQPRPSHAVAYRAFLEALNEAMSDAP
jgi:transcriptional regulator with XRE-family HTH domain